MSPRARVFAGYVGALLVPIAALILRWALENLVGGSLPHYVTFYPVVMLVALAAGLGPGLAATATAALLADYFILPPFGVGIARPVDVVGLAVFTGMGVFMSMVAERLRRTRDHLEETVAVRTEALMAANEELAAANEELQSQSEELIASFDELKSADEALRLKEQTLSFHMENSPMAVIEWDKDLIVRRWTGESERMFGWSTVEAVGKPIMDLQMVYGEDIPIVQEVIARLTDGTTRKVVSTNRNYTKSGDIRHCTWYNSVLADQQGQMSSVLSKVIDITEQKRAEEALQRQSAELEAARVVAENEKQFLAAVMDALPTGLAITDMRGGTIKSNKAFEMVWGGQLPAAQSVADYVAYKAWWVDTGRPVTPEEWASAIAVRTGETTVGQMMQIQRFDGSRAFVINSASPVRDAEGTILGCAVALQDISELKHAEDALQKIAARHNLLSETGSILLGNDSSQQIIDSLCVKIMTFLDCHVFFNFLVDEETGRLHLNACSGIPEGEEAKIEWLDYDVAICGCAARDACRIVAEDVQNTPDSRTELVKSYGITAYACHPLMAKGRVLGTLSFGTRTRSGFSDDDLSMMKAVADQVAMAIERKKAEEALRRSERLYRAIGESIDYGIWICASDGRNIYASDSFLKLVGMTQEECSNFGWGDVLHPDDAERTIAAWKECARTGGVWDIEHRFRGVDGQWHPVLARGVPVRDDQGAITCWAGINLDISRMKEAEEKLRASEERLRLALSAAHLAAWDWYMPSGTVIWNDEHFRMMGYEPGEITPSYRAWADRIHPEDVAATEASIRECMATASVYKAEFRTLWPDGTVRWLEARGEFEYDAAGRPLRNYGVMIDRTDRKLAEDELQQAHDELERRVEERTIELTSALNVLRDETSERIRAVEALHEQEKMLIQQSRLAAMGEMISNIAHQWRQPLNVLGLLIQELPMMYDRDEFSVEYLNARVEKAKEVLFHMSGTIDDFRNFFRPDREKIPFPIGQAVARTLSLVEESFKSQKITVKVDASADPAFTGYPNEFSQVLLNILTNARDAFVERNVAEPWVVTVTIATEKEKAVVTIADNAGGIPAEIMDRIFEPYFTTKGPDRGTGIGLFLAKTIIEKNMHGRLTARNSNNGAEFRIEVCDGARE